MVASLMRPARKASATALAGAVATATGAANSATGSAAAAASDRVLAQAAKNQSEAIKTAIDTALDQAEAIVLSGDVSYDPVPNQSPLGRSDGTLNPNWIRGVLEPEQWLENVSANQGIVAPDSSEVDFTPQMMLEIKGAWIPANPTQEITLLNDGVMGLYITVDKKLQFNYYGVFETTQALGMSDDWVDIAIVNNDNEQDTTTFFALVNGRLFDTIQVAEFSPLALRNMLDGEDGFSWIVSPGHCALTSAGTNKTQAAGDPIGLLRDLGPNGINAAQATAAARPILTMEPVGGRRNFGYAHEDSPHIERSTATNYILTGFAIINGYPLHRILANRTAGASNQNGIIIAPRVRNGQEMTLSWVVSGEHFTQYNIARTTSSIPGASCTFNLSTLEVTGSTSTLTNYGIEPLGSNLFRLYVSFATVAGAILNYGNGYSCAPIGTEPGEFWIGAWQPEYAHEPTIFQYVHSQNKVSQAGIPDCYYAYFDGSDDVLSATIPEISNGTLIIAGPNGVWIDDDINAAAGTFSLGPTTYTGGPAGLITTLLGGVINAFLIGRQLTEPELESHLNQCKTLGAAPVRHRIGAELILSIDLENGVWTPSNGCTITGATTFSVTGTGGVWLPEIIESGKAYLISAELSATPGRAFQLRDGTTGTDTSPIIRQVTGTPTSIVLSPTAFVARNTAVYLRSNSAIAGDLDITALSLKEIVEEDL